MSKKLEQNGLWESSRMMLPQHKESVQRRLGQQAAAQPSRPTTEEMNMMKDFVLLPIMHSIIMRRALEMERSSETLRALYTKVAKLLARSIYEDLRKVKRSLMERDIRVVEEEKDEQMVRYRYVCRQYEDSFVITRDYMRAEASKRIGRYAETLVSSLYKPNKVDS